MKHTSEARKAVLAGPLLKKSGVHKSVRHPSRAQRKEALRNGKLHGQNARVGGLAMQFRAWIAKAAGFVAVNDNGGRPGD